MSNFRHIRGFFRYLETRNRSTHTLKNYESDLRFFIQFIEAFFSLSVFKVRPHHIDSYLHFLRAQRPPELKLIARLRLRFIDSFERVFLRTKYQKRKREKAQLLRLTSFSVATQKRKLSSLKHFYEYMIEAHPLRLKKSPFLAKRHNIKLKDSDQKHTKRLSFEQFKTLMNECKKIHLRLAMCLMYYEGLRIEEVIMLNQDQFNRETNELIFFRKGGKRHHLKLRYPDRILPLWDYVFSKNELQSLDGPLFQNSKGNRLNKRSLQSSLQKHFDEFLEINHGVTPHSFRKACASQLYHETKDLLLVRDFLGHSDAKVTQTYISMS